MASTPCLSLKPGIWILLILLNHHAGMRTLFQLLSWCLVPLEVSQDSPKRTPSMANSIKPIYLKTYTIIDHHYEHVFPYDAEMRLLMICQCNCGWSRRSRSTCCYRPYRS